MKRSIQSKGCKRCGGDLSWEQDKYGTYLSCIQCGAEHQPPMPATPFFSKADFADNLSPAGMLTDRLVGAGSR